MLAGLSKTVDPQPYHEHPHKRFEDLTELLVHDDQFAARFFDRNQHAADHDQSERVADAPLRAEPKSGSAAVG